MKWIVSQLSARENYAVPRALAQRGQLDTLFTEVWCGFGNGLLRCGPAPLRALAGRFHPALKCSRVVSFTWRSMLRRAASWRRRAELDLGFLADEWLAEGLWFDRRVATALRRRRFDLRDRALFAYSTGCLETIQYFRDLGLFTAVDQVDPGRVEQDLVIEERKKWPDWEARCGELPGSYYDRLCAEWTAADVVVVNSPWSAEALARQSVPLEKIAVVPLAYESADPPPRPRDYASRPLTILWLGSVLLRKGIPYLVEAAHKLKSRGLKFRVVGPLEITARARAEAPENLEWVGPVTRDRAAGEYMAADVFVIPTISDGFAITQIEAMAHGLPVIATPNCGQVVEHGRDGLIVPAGDADALAGAIAALDDDRSMLADMARAAVEKSRRFSLAAVGDALATLADRHSAAGQLKGL